MLATSSHVLSFLAVVHVATAKTRTWCTPGSACFPSSAQLTAFNATVGGRLIKTIPYAAVCYDGPYYNATACESLVSNQTQAGFRHEIPNAMMFNNWEFGENGLSGEVGCLAPSTVPTAPLNGTCELGAQAPFVVNATSAAIVQASVKFARKYNLRLRVKNTGHCYTGRSAAPGSFTIWTHYLKDTAFIPSFVANECTGNGEPVFSAGTGVQVQELYDAAERSNVTAIGGFTPRRVTTVCVGALGGYILGGGIGPMSNKYGLGVDSTSVDLARHPVLTNSRCRQYEVVTTDGEIRIANACQNADLFWALRGGGGAFGVTTHVWLKAHPPFVGVNAVTGYIRANDTDTYSKIVETLVEKVGPSMINAGLPGIWQSRKSALLAFFDQGETVVPAQETYDRMSDLWSIPGATFQVSAKSHSSWNQAYKQTIAPIILTGAVVGINLLDFSRVVSNTTIMTEEGRKGITDYIVNLPGDIPFIYQVNAGGAVNQVGPEEFVQTAIHPAWRDSQVFGPSGGATAEQEATVAEVRDGATKAFGPAAYYNENIPGEDSWQDAYFGSNYPRLLALKKKWDPTGALTCRECVGSDVFGF
ncbi:FAD-binding domain-containing protein [Auriculariales sp. MPI-PUGE-AT-0066]|nr:FAD-binding domain-containing protein [Auriculariales sp. MPI-PUGE-AT-0066]